MSTSSTYKASSLLCGLVGERVSRDLDTMFSFHCELESRKYGASLFSFSFLLAPLLILILMPLETKLTSMNPYTL